MEGVTWGGRPTPTQEEEVLGAMGPGEVPERVSRTSDIWAKPRRSNTKRDSQGNKERGNGMEKGQRQVERTTGSSG